MNDDNEELEFQPSLNELCVHGLPLIIVCPKCHPEKYKMTPEIIEGAKRAQANWEEHRQRHPR